MFLLTANYNNNNIIVQKNTKRKRFSYLLQTLMAAACCSSKHLKFVYFRLQANWKQSLNYHERKLANHTRGAAVRFNLKSIFKNPTVCSRLFLFVLQKPWRVCSLLVFDWCVRPRWHAIIAASPTAATEATAAVLHPLLRTTGRPFARTSQNYPFCLLLFQKSRASLRPT